MMFGSFILLWLVFCLVFFLVWIRRDKNFPPGPRPFPIFGNLLQITLENPLEDLGKLAERYGDVYSLFIGPTPVVVVNGLQAIKEALVTKAADFAGRPKELMMNHIIQQKAPGVVLADYNHGWREHRRFALMTLRNFGLGKQSMEDRILGEINHMVALLDSSIGKTLNPHVLFHNAANNIICQVLFGTRHTYGDEFIKLFVGIFKEVSKILNGPWAMLYDSVPIVRCLPLPFQKSFKLIRAGHLKLMELVVEHKKTRVPGKPRDLLDCYLDELEKSGTNDSFSEDQLIAYVLDLQFAGTDTTSNTLLTGFLYLMNYPQIQERCQQEIDRVLEGKDQATFEDGNQMPYVQAVAHEIFRIANTVPLSVFHCTTKDTELKGYSIPRGTVIIPNLSSVLFETGQWKFPHEFNPENFLNDQGEFVKPEAFMPFSAGPRMCLGEGLARMELFLIMVTLLRRFRFIWPEDAGQPDYSPVFGSVISPKPYQMYIRLRQDTQ